MNEIDIVNKLGQEARNIQSKWGKMSVVSPGYMLACNVKFPHYLVNMEVYDLQPMNTVESFFQHLGFFMPWKWKNLKRSRKSFEELEVVFRDRDVAEYCAMCSPEKILRFTDLYLNVYNSFYKNINNADKDDLRVFKAKLKRLAELGVAERPWELLANDIVHSHGESIALCTGNFIAQEMPIAKYIVTINPFNMLKVLDQLIDKINEYDEDVLKTIQAIQ